MGRRNVQISALIISMATTAPVDEKSTVRAADQIREECERPLVVKTIKALTSSIIGCNKIQHAILAENVLMCQLYRTANNMWNFEKHQKKFCFFFLHVQLL